MNPAEFLYYYAKDYLQDYVKACLMMENWTDKDCLPFYKKYVGDYRYLRGSLGRISDGKMMASINLLRETRLNKTYNYLFNDVLERIKSKKGAVSDDKKNMLSARLMPYRLLKNADFNYSFELRKIEEEEY